jgi:hypothetical protein
VDTQSAPHTAEYCLARAFECDQKAEQTMDPKNKAIFFDLANRWRTLAQESKDGTSLKPIGGRSGARLSPVGRQLEGSG